MATSKGDVNWGQGYATQWYSDAKEKRKLVSDRYWASVLAAKDEVQAEINQVHAEAKALKAGWEKVIMQQAMKMLQHQAYLNAKQAQEKKDEGAIGSFVGGQVEKLVREAHVF